MPAVVCIWESFSRLARGRDYTAFGDAMPIKYRDLLDEVERCDWPDKAQAENFLCALDDKFLAMARARAAREREKT